MIYIVKEQYCEREARSQEAPFILASSLGRILKRIANEGRIKSGS